jgi:adhesin transport system membrane fusion protein
MTFAPWQQTVTGEGYVVAYAPRERQQTLEATIEGRIIRWNEELVENARVARGDFIAEIRDIDDRVFCSPPGEQLENTSAILQSSKEDCRMRPKDSSMPIVEFRTEVEAAQNAYVQSAMQKVSAAEQKLAIAEAAIPQLKAAFDRARELHAAGNIALEKLQEIERKLLESQGKVKEESANLSAARAELMGKQSDRERPIFTKPPLTSATMKARWTKREQKLSKADKELHDMESKVARQNTQQITAPFDGYIVHISSSNGGSQLVKKGDPICTLVPVYERSSRADLAGR